MIHFLIQFILWLLVGSLFCNGWYTITRGYYAQLPDYKKVKAGEIFGFWERFWEKQIRVREIWITGDSAEKKYAELVYMKKDLADKFELNGILFYAIEEIDINDIITVERLLNCKLKGGNAGGYLLYWEKPIFRFPMWIQKPVSRCPTCMASVYGSLLWLIFIQQEGLFEWFYYKKIGAILFWFLFIVSLSFINSYVGKKSKQLH